MHGSFSSGSLLEMPSKDICYSDKYKDDQYEYRHVFLPKDLVHLVPKTHLMTETEWRSIGVQQSRGWIHYMIHEPEPHVLLFKRPLTGNDLPVQANGDGRGDGAMLMQR